MEVSVYLSKTTGDSTADIGGRTRLANEYCLEPFDATERAKCSEATQTHAMGCIADRKRKLAPAMTYGIATTLLLMAVSYLISEVLFESVLITASFAVSAAVLLCINEKNPREEEDPLGTRGA